MLNARTTGRRWTLSGIGSPQVKRTVAWLVMVLVGTVGCEGPPADPSNPPHDRDPPGILRLTPTEIARAGIQVEPAAVSSFRLYREFPATVQANENELAEVTALIRGRVVRVAVDVGQDVTRGHLLAVLHSTDLGLAEGVYLKAKALLYEADLAYRRARNLHEQKAISLAVYQRREAEMKTARAELEQAKNRLELLGVPGKEIDRLDREQSIRADVPLTAPFDGRVIMRNVTRGEVVETNQKLFTVADLSDVWVVANVPEKDVQFVRKDDTAEVVVAAYPHALVTGRITYVGDVLDPATRTMRLRVTVPNPDTLLKPEMFAVVRVYAAPKSVITVPLSAVQTLPAGRVVFVRRAEGEFEARPVTVGEEQGDRVAVVEGLQPGDPVVVKGAFVLKSESERHRIEAAP